MMAALDQPVADARPQPGDPVELVDGTVVTIRVIQPADAYALLRMFDRLSPESLYHRFFSPMPQPRRAALLHLAGLDHELHEAVVAEVDREIVGVARYDGRTGEDDAEVAVIVDDAWQNRGLGTRLLHGLAGVGARRGLVAFRAVVLGENRRALPFLRRLSPEAEIRFRGGEYQVYAPFRVRRTEPSARGRHRSAERSAIR
jgi:GNAT superfamily N-acetyltransferase